MVLETIDSTLSGIDPVISAAIAAGLAAFVVTMLIINRDARLDINIDALVLGEPGAFGAGVALVLMAPAFGQSGMVVLAIGLILIAAAVVSWTSDRVNF